MASSESTIDQRLQHSLTTAADTAIDGHHHCHLLPQHHHSNRLNFCRTQVANDHILHSSHSPSLHTIHHQQAINDKQQTTKLTKIAKFIKRKVKVQLIILIIDRLVLLEMKSYLYWPLTTSYKYW